ncbi:MAG: MBL fold metallo-hydrolase [Acidimicrobiia bacterium]|nr:MBL fold metallo-hydrolase [Acidimicrobiia bacterium]MBT8215506.1 MBL fold metallo-hydrolase [Acidimicrobiia bacterium]NNF09866.1 MBL fold metallo-hydrolase [Acidimicrobiia bacterium]NNL70833.1 MBL fold metallo-hydrolase [Acidimicrobiia bacterium]
MSHTITTDDLAQRVDDAARAPFILDVRATDQFERWRIEGKAALAIENIPYWTALTDLEQIVSKLPEHQEVVVVCAHGGSSGMVAEMVDRPNVHNLEGGMDAWANTLVPRTLFDDGTHFVVQLDRIAKACLSYAVGARGQTVALIDPSGSVEPYLAIAEEMGAQITDVFDTHLHADHISLGRQLATHANATYHLSPGDGEDAAFDFTALVDGEVFTFGDMDLIVRSVATPGHTPGSTSLEVHERYLMTGDAVFVSGVGRPDLGGETEPWARDLFNTIHAKLSPLAPELEVCPAHYTARAESRDDGTVRRQLGDLLNNDAVVSIADEAEFVDYVVSHLGEPPEVYAKIRLVNLGLSSPDPELAKELEVGRNECALSK